MTFYLYRIDIMCEPERFFDSVQGLEIWPMSYEPQVNGLTEVVFFAMPHAWDWYCKRFYDNNPESWKI